MKTFARTFAVLVFVFQLGCGGGGSPAAPTVACHPAKGTINIAGKPAVGAKIILIPPKDTDPRPRATVGADGLFALSTNGVDDGAPVGEYGIVVFWPGSETDDQLNGRYNSVDKTKVKIKIAAGNNDIPAIQLK